MSKVASVLNDLKAEVLLEGSYILTQIEDLRSRLTVQSEGKQLNFDDYFFHIQKLIDEIPRIELLNRIPKMNESNYTIELIESLDIVQEKILDALNKAITFQTTLTEVETAMQEVSGTFEAWYLLALTERLDQLELNLPVATRKGLAASEFNRLMGGTRVAVLSLQTALKAERERLAAKKKMAREKFDMGREQVNASWTNRLPEMMGISSQPGKLGVLKEDEPEEEGEVTFISKRKPLSLVPATTPMPYFTENLPDTPVPEVSVNMEERTTSFVMTASISDHEELGPIGEGVLSEAAGQEVAKHVIEALNEFNGKFGMSLDVTLPAVTSANEPAKEAYFVTELGAAFDDPKEVSVDPDAVIEPAIQPAEKPALGQPRINFEAIAEEMTEANTGAIRKALDIKPKPLTDEALEEILVEALEGPVMALTGGTVEEIRELITGHTIGIDLGSGEDQTVLAIIESETNRIVHTEIVPKGSSVSPENGEIVPQTGFYKTGTPAPATEITAAQAIATFNDVEDDGIVDTDEIAEEAEAEDALISAEDEVIESVNHRTPTPTPEPTKTTVVAFEDDELDDLIVASKPVHQAPTPVQEEVKASTPAPAAPAPRKKLVFDYSEDEI